ncbi:MAG: FprA family A-type flavoprotein [Candidatus Ranarchaeia archaeon]|jgi:flavorubredoxin
MTAIEFKPGVYWVGVNVRTDDKFEGMWPIPHGVSLNSYVVKGKKTAVIDIVREWKGSAMDFHRQLSSAGIKEEDIDYIVLNHLEPDHTELLLSLIRSAPKAEIITSEKGAKMVEAFYNVTKNIHIVKTGDILDLGGKTLQFYEIPYVHWPETMVTYLKEDKVLFSCDAFGSFGSLDGAVFDDETPPERHTFLYEESLRYYANIVALYSNMVLRAIEALKPLDIKVIAPSHGLIWRKNPGEIVKRYLEFANYGKGINLKPKITVIYGSMYGNTESMLDAILRGMAKVEGVEIEVFECANDNQSSYILSSAWESGGLVFGMPTYEGKMFPPMVSVLDHLTRKGVKHKSVFRFGSYGWSGGAQRDFESQTKNAQWDMVPPFEFNGGPTLEDLQEGEKKGEEFAKLIKEKYGR